VAIIEFPSPESADENGIVATGGDLELPSLLLAYSQGIFPWPISEDFPLAWFSPDPRGVLHFKDLHISRSTQKIINRNTFEIRFNSNFESVIKECASSNNRKEGNQTWITDDIIHAYLELHRHGYAYSVEAYANQRLVGGLYGVQIGRFVSGESMFYLENNASKIALISLIHHLKSQGITWLDTQMVTPIVSSLGGVEIPRKEFLRLLKSSIP